MSYSDKIDKERIPAHIAIIMDGNGRWAQQNEYDRSLGHQAGVQSVHKVVKETVLLGVKHLTLYTFSTENWNRPAQEVSALMELLFNSIEDELLMKNNVRFRIIGDLNSLPPRVRERIGQCMEKTSVNTGMTLVLALSYSSRWEITEAVKEISLKVKNGQITVDDINDKLIDQSLQTSFMPNPDLLIRTGNEQRLSNFLLWQAAYSELFFTPTLWPDFGKEQLCEAIYSYQQRERRFGKISQQINS